MPVAENDYKAVALFLVKKGYIVPDGDSMVSGLLMEMRAKNRKKETDLAEFRIKARDEGLLSAGVGGGCGGWEYQDMQYNGSMFGSGEW